MQGFAAVLAEVALARAVSDTAGPAEKADVQRLVAELLVSCPKTIDRIGFELLCKFLSDPETDIVHASAVARALPRTSLSTFQELLTAYLARPDLSLADFEPFVTPDAACVLAFKSDRPDVLERVFADPDVGTSDAVQAALTVNHATPPEIRILAASNMLNLYDPDVSQFHVLEALRALRNQPEIQQPVFDLLNLSDTSMLRIFDEHKLSWTCLNPAQLDRLTVSFTQAVQADAQPLAWDTCSRGLMLHQSMTVDTAQRLIAAVDAVCTVSSVPAVYDWFRELSEGAKIMAAPNRVAALFDCKAPPVRHHVQWSLTVLASASAADLVAVLTDLTVRRHRPWVLRDIVRHAALEVCTAELLAVLPVASFREWRARTPDVATVDAVFAELLSARLGTDQAAWRMFAELAEAADAEATIGDIADLAASLTADQ